MISIFTIIISLTTTATAAATSQAPTTHHLNCTFTLLLTETCHPSLTTSAALTPILSPWRAPLTPPTEALAIDAAPLSIYARSPQESIAGRLDVARPNNTKVEFRWTYGPSGGRPVTEGWSEDGEGAEGRYGCVVERGWDGSGGSCDGADAEGGRKKVLGCWFKCNAVADSES
ncbi:hypothetical protein PMIN06_012736 [Paraphaeosphaeria minitans]